MRKSIIVSLVISASLGCTALKNQPFVVSHMGALMDIMHEGDISGRINLLDLKGKENLYALGSVEWLKGEITIIDGISYVSQIHGEEMKTALSFDHKASLLVYTQVKNWKELEIPDSISTHAQLERYIPRLAEENGIDITKPFPFMLLGTVRSINWHVIDWKKGDREHTHEKHKNSGASGVLKDAEASILGFYSVAHQRIWTHHSTFMHLHAFLKKENISSHVDDLTIGPRTILKIPKL